MMYVYRIMFVGMGAGLFVELFTGRVDVREAVIMGALGTLGGLGQIMMVLYEMHDENMKSKVIAPLYPGD